MCDNDTATTTTSQVMKKRGEGKLKLLEAPDIIKMSPMKIGRGPSLYYVSKRTGWVGLEMTIFADIQYWIYADKVGGVQKGQKYADVL